MDRRLQATTDRTRARRSGAVAAFALERHRALGWRAIAPDLPGYGDSEPDTPATWERHVEARRWHDVANLMRTPAEGEKLVAAYTREGFAAALGALSSGMGEDALEEYWKAFADEPRRRGQLELYRSGDFEKLLPYEGRLVALDLPALILWGDEDRFAGVQMAQRFHEELTRSELVILAGVGHFVWDDQPERTNDALVDFLQRRG